MSTCSSIHVQCICLLCFFWSFATLESRIAFNPSLVGMRNVAEVNIFLMNRLNQTKLAVFNFDASFSMGPFSDYFVFRGFLFLFVPCRMLFQII